MPIVRRQAVGVGRVLGRVTVSAELAGRGVRFAHQPPLGAVVRRVENWTGFPYNTININEKLQSAFYTIFSADI